VGARSGDKGGNANLGVWAKSGGGFEWMADYLTVDRLKVLLPEIEGLNVERFDLPNLGALNFVIHGLLGEGASSSSRVDPQAKSLGEFLRSRVVRVPAQTLQETYDHHATDLEGR
jgi:hypothetical protein